MKQPSWVPGRARRITRSGLCIALLAVSARMSIPLPFYPVAFSMQTFVVLVMGLLLCPADSFFSMLGYLGLGLAGAPVFSQGGGLSYVLEPSFGYLLGFLFAAPLVSILSRRLRGDAGRVVACALASLLLSALGIAYFALIQGVYLHAPITLQMAWYMFYVYLPLDVAKLLLSVCAAAPLQRRLGAWL